ncbi:MAG TPA: FhaA domain-containing protein [Aldersonia sp.]
MGIVSRFERRLRNTVDDAFARVFGGSVMPKEVETALEREAVDHVRELDGGHQLAPNSYVITINSTDREKLAADGDTAKRQFSRHLQDYIKAQGWQTYGDVHVEFEASPSLHTGQFRARGIVDPDVGRKPAPPPTPPKPPQPGAAMPQNSGPDEGREPAAGQDRPSARDSERDFDARDVPPPEQHPGPRNGSYQSYGPPRENYPDPRYPDHRQGQRYPDQAYSDPRYDYPRQDYPPRQPYPGDQRYDPRYDERDQQHRDQQHRDQHYPNQDYPNQDYQDRNYGRDPHPGSRYDDRTYSPPPQGGGGYQAYSQQPGYGHPGYDRQGNQQGYEQNYDRPPYGYEDRYDESDNYADYPAGATYTATLQLDDGSGRTYQLRDGGNIVGRGQDAHFRLPDTGVSRRHFEVRWDGQTAMLSDLGSTNGTTVNGAPVQDWQLADGDVIRAGHSEIIIRMV